MTTTRTNPGLVDLVITRRLSPPAHVTLRPAHLPAPCADAFQALQDALVAERQTQEAADKSRGDQQQAELAAAAKDDTNRAVERLTAVTAASSAAITDSAAAAFEDALAAALGAIRQAERLLEEAQHARALGLRVKPGRGVTNLGLDSRTLRDDGVWQQLAIVRQGLRDAVDVVAAGGVR